MQRIRTNGLLALAAVLAAAAGYFAQNHFLSAGGKAGGETRPAFTLPDLDGTQRSMAEFDGKVVVLNFWATWCPPCRDEIPDFVELQSRYAGQGVQFIGIANDEVEQVRSFIREVPVNYITLIGDLDGAISRAYGNDMGVLPYTVVIDRAGKVAAVRPGIFAKDALESVIKGLL
jgi:peroxiredoxin